MLLLWIFCVLELEDEQRSASNDQDNGYQVLLSADIVAGANQRQKNVNHLGG